jgi:hypothetical protein
MYRRSRRPFLSPLIRLLANLIPFYFYALFTTDQDTDQDNDQDTD